MKKLIPILFLLALYGLLCVQSLLWLDVYFRTEAAEVQSLNEENFTECKTVRGGEGILDTAARIDATGEWDYALIRGANDSFVGFWEHTILNDGGGPVIVQPGDEVCLMPDGKG